MLTLIAPVKVMGDFPTVSTNSPHVLSFLNPYFVDSGVSDAGARERILRSTCRLGSMTR